MKRREFLRLSALGAIGLGRAAAPFQAAAQATRKILIAGGGFGTGFIRYMASLTGVPRPKLLYLPTASADSQTGIIGWYRAAPRWRSTRSSRTASSPAPVKSRVGKRCCSRSTASSPPAGTR